MYRCILASGGNLVTYPVQYYSIRYVDKDHPPFFKANMWLAAYI